MMQVAAAAAICSSAVMVVSRLQPRRARPLYIFIHNVVLLYLFIASCDVAASTSSPPASGSTLQYYIIYNIIYV